MDDVSTWKRRLAHSADEDANEAPEIGGMTARESSEDLEFVIDYP